MGLASEETLKAVLTALESGGIVIIVDPSSFAGLALASTQTDGTQKTKIVDSSGNSIDATHPVPVTPGTGALWDVSDRAARLLGVVTAASGAALALNSAQTDGTQKAIARGGAKGATTPADVTSTPNGVDHQAMDLAEQFASPAEDNAGSYAGQARFVVEERWTPYPITDVATHDAIISGAGTFGGIVINKATASAVITVYDALTATGTPIATITMPMAILASQIVLKYNVRLTTGLTIVTSVAAQDLTVLARP
jgi:hypothetical protein